VRLISLQKGPGVEQIEKLSGSFEVIQFGDLDTASGPFRDTMALMHSLDLIVSADTCIPHLAGAMNLPVWLALSFSPDWRWLLDRDDSPWYPSARLFRQRVLGDWEEVFQRMASEVAKRQKINVPAERGMESRAGWQEAAERETTRRSIMNRSATIAVEVSPGELIDKITILEIKSERMSDLEKLKNVRTELATLIACRDRAIPPSTKLDELTRSLKDVNEALWQIEDEIRDCERNGDFGAKFVELARSVYRSNDRRSTVKRQINELLGSSLIEEKSYAPY